MAASGEYLRGLTAHGKTKERAATCVEEDVCGTPGRTEDYCVDNMIQTLNTSSLDTNDEGTSTWVFRATAHSLQKVRIIRSDNDRHHERAQNIKDYQTVNETFTCPGNVTSWSLALADSNGDCFWGKYERKARADERSPECEEFARVPESRPWVAIECSRIFPVAEAESIIIGSTAEEEHGAEDDKPEDSDDLDRGKPELSLAVNADCEDIEKNDSDKYKGDPCCNVSIAML